MPKVSVVIPTYNTPQDGLSLLIDSLDRQTLSPAEFEVIFVDDGSTDDTFAALQLIAAARSNVRLERIENSGWPSTPRNVGLDLAAGEYVLFMDHDDQLYPDALRAGYEYARAHGADALNGKEAYTNTAFWALTTYTGDLPQAMDRDDPHPLLPLNPHKLYRRAFLQEHGIRFPEGRKVLWEDQVFNIRVARHAQVISTLSSVPFYHWVHTKDSGSTLFVKATDDYWFWFRRLLEETSSVLSTDEFAPQREWLLHYQYSARVLGVFDNRFADRPDEEKTFLFEHAARIQADFGLTRFDDQLSASRRLRAWCLASGDAELMSRLCAADPEVAGVATLQEREWRDGVLHLTATAEWPRVDGRGALIERRGERLFKKLPDDLAGVVPAEVLDMTADIAGARVDASVRSRTARIVWLAPTHSQVRATEGDDGLVELSATFTATVDPATVAMGGELDSTYWDLFAQSQIGTWMTHKPLHSTLAASVTVAGKRLHLVYPNDGGAGTVIPDGQIEAVRRLAPVAARRIAPGRYEVELAGTHDGAGQVDTRVGLSVGDAEKPAYSEVAATLRIEDGRAYVRFAVPQPHVTVRIGDRAPGGAPGWHLELGEQGSPLLSLTPVKKADGSQTRILLLTNRDSDNVGDQIIEATVISLLKGVMNNLGIAVGEYVINSRAAGIISKRYMTTGDPALLADARKAISAADVIVFGGAPLFNYSYQSFYKRTIKTLELAEEYGVPVLFSSIGVEKFDAGNAKSLALRDALRLDCVRQITTRDDFASLQQYVQGTDIPVAHVADPAVFADLVFGAPPVKERPRKKVGLVVTRAGIFKDNGIVFTEQDQRRFWRETMALLTEKGYDYRLFTTGHFSDEVFLDAFMKAEGIPLSKAAVAVNSPEELAQELRSCDGVIAYRLHASITSFAYGIPSIGLSWNFKVPHFYESVGYGRRALDASRWTAPEVVGALETAMEEGVVKDEAFLMTVYETLFAGMKSILQPDADRGGDRGGDRRPFSYAELQERLPAYPGTTAAQYRDKVRNKLRRAYENYQKYYTAGQPSARPSRPSLARRVVRRARRLLGGRR